MRVCFLTALFSFVVSSLLYSYAQSDYSITLSNLNTANKSLEMVYVQGGSYQRGCSDGDTECETQEKPTHRVTLSDYYISKYELTNAQWQAVMADNTTKDNKPKTSVTWYDAISFTCKLSEQTGKKYRLATDAEFEFAARGGNKSKGTLYSGSNNADDVAWYSGNIKETCFGDFCFKSAQDVGTKAPNELGIYDMSGNVYEWMYDSYGTFSEGDLTNPTGPATLHTQKVRRGGSYDQPASESRVSGRKIRSIEGKDGSIGIRLAISVTDSRPEGMLDPCDIQKPPPTGGKPGFYDERLINADGEAWVNELMENYINVLIIKENAAIYASVFNNTYVTEDAKGQWYTLNSFSLNIVPSSGTQKKYIYYLVDSDNLSLMPEGGMPGRYQRRNIADVVGASKVTLPSITNPKKPEELAPAGYSIDMKNPPTDGRDSRLIEGPNNAWLQDNVALGAGGTHRYRFDFDNDDYTRFFVYDPPSFTSLAKGTWYTVDNTFLRIFDDNGYAYDYLYTVSEDGNTYYHISFQSYEVGDFRLFEKVSASAVPSWVEPSSSVNTFYQGASTYIPPSEDNIISIKKDKALLKDESNVLDYNSNLLYYNLKGKPLGKIKPRESGVYIAKSQKTGKVWRVFVK